jgi:putative transposase
VRSPSGLVRADGVIDLPIIDLETMPDHVHPLVSVDPRDGIHRLVKQVKPRSSRLLRQQFPHPRSRLPTLWTNPYFAATVGGATLEVVKRCVENQRNVLRHFLTSPWPKPGVSREFF